jgi:hypothetical protein
MMYKVHKPGDSGMLTSLEAFELLNIDKYP